MSLSAQKQPIDIGAVQRHALELARMLLPTGMLLTVTRERAESLPKGTARQKYLRQVRALERSAARKGIQPMPSRAPTG